MKLLEITEAHFDNMLSIHNSDDGLINCSLSKLFECMNNESNKYEVMIKVAALNQIYSTSIRYILPVVDKITSEVSETNETLTESGYVALVDRISEARWTSLTTRKNHIRKNLSFASKYIHFLSDRKIPIYDSYIWIVMVGYLKQSGRNEYSFSAPDSYRSFYDAFVLFKNSFGLKDRTNYDIDKFLWQYGKHMLNKIQSSEGVDLDRAKSILKSRITRYLTLKVS